MRQQRFRLQGDVSSLHPIEDQYIILVCSGALLIVSVEQSRADLYMNLPAGMRSYILDMRVLRVLKCPRITKL